jgi:hypothetical protein
MPPLKEVVTVRYVNCAKDVNKRKSAEKSLCDLVWMRLRSRAAKPQAKGEWVKEQRFRGQGSGVRQAWRKGKGKRS